MMHACTIQRADGTQCGEPAVRTFLGFSGERYYECAEHAGPAHYAGRPDSGVMVGDEVPVQRHGKEYIGRVVRITRGGNVFARVRYQNGAERVVLV